MNKILKFVICAVATTSAQPCAAADWWYLSTDDSGLVTFADAQSLRSEGKIVTVWIESFPFESRRSVGSQKTLIKVDCQRHTLKHEFWTAYGPRGDVLHQESSNEPPTPIIPETPGEDIAWFGCDGPAKWKAHGFQSVLNPADWTKTAHAIRERSIKPQRRGNP